ncbi:glycine betaine ABC transporter substrate-binding protein [Nocardia stercoris]|uniref:Transporter n=1 Tax=Nocardia stercoris TaxID=2483361 RepID=A0A3M2LD70_9NOCA|nr:glycine betaine ABC transporter substrate-binding protein [Nocardia stercoris]RMI35046.1 transporter [Nocardia stercoris]
MRFPAAVRLVAGATAALAVSCSNAPQPAEITVGAGDSAQSELIGQIYAQALARTGAHTAVRTGLGQRADLLAALDAGTVTLVGDTSGDLLATFDPGSPARKPDRSSVADPAVPTVADALSRALPQGLATSDIADGTDLRPEFVLTPATAAHQPATLAALAPHCGELTVGVAAGHALDPLRPAPDPEHDVLAPLRAAGCDITNSTVFTDDLALRTALRDGRVDAGVLTAPAALLPGGAGELVTVADDTYVFRARNELPLLRSGALSDTQVKKLNYVAGELNTAEFCAAVRQVRDEHASAADVARTWLDAHGL